MHVAPAILSPGIKKMLDRPCKQTDRSVYLPSMVTQREIQAEVTREKILQAAAEEIYRVGFQAASIGDILKKLGISKGALYHHFASKQELGYAVLDDVLCGKAGAAWDAALNHEDPIVGLCDMLECMAGQLEGQRLHCGCPINNLAQEMSPVDEGFRARLEKIYASWHRRIQNALAGAQQRGLMRADVDASEAAYFIIAAMQGAMGLAKNAQDCAIFRASVKGLALYLNSLKQVVA